MNIRRLAIIAVAALALSCAGEKKGDQEETATDDVRVDSTVAAADPAVPEQVTDTVVPVESVQPPIEPKDTVTRLPAEITLTMSNSRTYNGNYHASGISRICGNFTMGMGDRERSWTFEFPYEGDFEITDVSFSADTLTSGSSTDKYYLSVGLRTADGRRPVSFVLRTKTSEFKETGHATLSVAGGTSRLTVNGRNELGEALEMTVVCKPKQS